MRTTINTSSEILKAPNKTIPLSVAAARELYKTSVNDLIEQIEQFNLGDFFEGLENTKKLAQLFGIPSEKVGENNLKDTLNELGVNEKQAVNNINYAPEKTIKLAGMAV